MFILYAKPTSRPFRISRFHPSNVIAMTLAKQLEGSESCWMVPGTFDCDGNSTL